MYKLQLLVIGMDEEGWCITHMSPAYDTENLQVNALAAVLIWQISLSKLLDHLDQVSRQLVGANYKLVFKGTIAKDEL